MERNKLVLQNMVTNTRIFADGASIEEIEELALSPYISGFTTNPSLMLKAGVLDYDTFAKTILALVPSKPVSFEVFADDMSGMYHEANALAGWGENVVVKIPVMTTDGKSTMPLVENLADTGINVNVTAIFTHEQCQRAVEALSSGKGHHYISYFAGRVADTLRDPGGGIVQCLEEARTAPNIEVIWASAREAYNYYQAWEIGCDIITMPRELIVKLFSLYHKSLVEFSRETVKMFHSDAQAIINKMRGEVA